MVDMPLNQSKSNPSIGQVDLFQSNSYLVGLCANQTPFKKQLYEDVNVDL